VVQLRSARGTSERDTGEAYEVMENICEKRIAEAGLAPAYQMYLASGRLDLLGSSSESSSVASWEGGVRLVGFRLSGSSTSRQTSESMEIRFGIASEARDCGPFESKPGVHKYIGPYTPAG
jgi:hypothetical protein